MDDEQFVKAVRQYVLDRAGQGIVTTLEAPPGRSPHPELVRRSEWYNTLDDASKQFVAEVAADGAHAALFGLFCVFDGARLIDDELRDGRLRITFEDENGTVVISDNQAISDLHDLLNAEWWDSTSGR